MEPRRGHRPGLISTRAQRRALASPVRQEILDALEAAGPRTMAELAGLLGRPQDALYFHVRTMLRVGLMSEVERRVEGRHVAAVFDVAGRPIELDYRVDRRGRAEIARVVAGAIRMSLREYQRACLSGETGGPEGVLRGGRAKGWLTPEEIARVRELLTELVGLFRSGKPRVGALPLGLGLLLSPCAVSPRASASNGSDRARPGKLKDRSLGRTGSSARRPRQKG